MNLFKKTRTDLQLLFASGASEMKSETEKKVVVSESRKIRKPLMEKKRRARINDSLETLKQILLDSKTALKESPSDRKSGQRSAKLEKADILEMTVRYVQHLRNKLNQRDSVKEIDSCDSPGVKMGVTLIPTKLTNGDIVFVMPSGLSTTNQNTEKFAVKISENVWRPWF